MSTQRLQHALSQALTRLREEYDQLNATIELLEARLRASLPKALSPSEGPKAERRARSGGRSSAGWTDDARAAVAARMRAYWQARREQKARAKRALIEAKAVAQVTSDDETVKAGLAAKKTPPSRSTAGWTDEARAEAASRMRARWQARRGDALGRA